jgi:hypothetical protein
LKRFESLKSKKDKTQKTKDATENTETGAPRARRKKTPREGWGARKGARRKPAWGTHAGPGE